MKKLLLSLLTVGLVSAVAIGATRAYFTDQEVLGTNSISTGKLDVELRGDYTDGIIIPVDTTQTFEGGLVPGSEFGPYAITVYNKGWGESTVPVKYGWTPRFTGGSGMLYNKIDVAVREGNCDWIDDAWFEGDGYLYQGALKDMPTNLSSLNPLGVNISRCTWFYFSLPTDAGNAYQGLNTQFDLVLNATQVENPGWAQ